MDPNELSKLIYVQISVFTHCLGRYYVSSKLKNTLNQIETRQDDIRKKNAKSRNYWRSSRYSIGYWIRNWWTSKKTKIISTRSTTSEQWTTQIRLTNLDVISPDIRSSVISSRTTLRNYVIEDQNIAILSLWRTQDSLNSSNEVNLNWIQNHLSWWKWRYSDTICTNGLSVILFKSRDASRKYNDGSSLEDDWSSKYIVSLSRNLEVKIDSRKYEIQSLHRDLLSKSKFDAKYLCENYQLSVSWLKNILSDIHHKRCTIPSCS